MSNAVCNSLNCQSEVILPDNSAEFVPSACCPPINLASFHGKTKNEVESVLGSPDDVFPQSARSAYYLGGGIYVYYTGDNLLATVITIYPENLQLNATVILTFLGLTRMSVSARSTSRYVAWPNDPNYGTMIATVSPDVAGTVFCIDILGTTV